MSDFSLTFKVTGVKSTIGNINGAVNGANNKAKGLVSRYAKNIMSDAKKSAPVSPDGIPKGTTVGKAPAPPSGTLRDSITMTTYFDGLGAMVYPEQSKAKYRHFAEMGTKERFQKNPPTYFMDRGSKEWQVNRTGNVGKYAGKFFMDGAKKRNARGFSKDLEKIYNIKRSV